MANSIVTIRDTQLEKQRAGFIQLSLTNFTNDDVPTIAAGSVVEISGSLFEVTVDEAITGWGGMGDGAVWIVCVPDAGGTFFTAEYSATAPTWSDAKQGWYDATFANRYVAGLTRVGTAIYRNKFYIQYGSQLQPKVLGINNVMIDFSKLRFIPTVLISESFNSSGIGITDIAVDPGTGNLISSDLNANLIYIYDGISDVVLSSFASPASTIGGVAVDRATGNLISSDFGTDRIYIHDGISAVVLSDFASPSMNNRGIDIDNATGNLISCDSGLDRIYIHDGISDVILSFFASPSTNIRGVAIDPGTGNLISCDSGLDRIYIHDGISDVILSFFASPSTNIQGVVIDPGTGNLISCDTDETIIYVHYSKLLYVG